jgi:hypothetical protein
VNTFVRLTHDTCFSPSSGPTATSVGAPRSVEVIAATVAAYKEGAGRAFADRLIRALEAGQEAGGDKRGKQAAALLIFSSEDYPLLSLRVDDHAEPLLELRRLYEESRRLYQPFLTFLPRRDNPAGVFDRAEIEAALPRMLEARER